MELIEAAPNAIQPDAGPWDIDREAYFADRTRVSCHALMDFGRSVPYYHARHVLGTVPEPEPTRDMQLGRAFDCLVLEPGHWESRYVVAPERIDRRTKRGKAQWAEFEAAAAGRDVVTADDWLLLRAMREGLMAQPHARAALEAAGPVQGAIRWTCPATGIPRRGLPDKVLANGLIADLKSLTTERFGERIPLDVALSKAVAGFGWHLQAATYLEGCWYALGAEGPFVLVAVAKESPHEVIVSTLGDETLAEARKQNLRLLRDLAHRRRTGDWSGRWQQQVTEINLPRYAFTNGEPL